MPRRYTVISKLSVSLANQKYIQFYYCHSLDISIVLPQSEIRWFLLIAYGCVIPLCGEEKATRPSIPTGQAISGTPLRKGGVVVTKHHNFYRKLTRRFAPPSHLHTL